MPDHTSVRHGDNASEQQLFYALAEPTRRGIIELLASKGQLSATDISDNFDVSPPAISQHLKVLRKANFVRVEKRAQQRIYRINPGAMSEIEQWIQKMTRSWNARFAILDEILEAEKRKTPSSLNLRPRHRT
ncbi:winged helix-turn-helix transcriptional regulator [Candidatus Bathyarchaeota archaeon]|nr:MAG: winged helix-turn-helix transcriptional regulator [Candidatus Bathyarchaeota archaeon]